MAKGTVKAMPSPSKPGRSSPTKAARSSPARPATPVRPTIVKKKKQVPSPLIKPGSVRPRSPQVPSKAAKATRAPKGTPKAAKASGQGSPSKASPKAAKSSAAAPKDGTKLNVNRFYAVAQCSLKAEARELMNRDFELHDPEAKKLWPAFERMAKRNLGSNEKWVPFHTVLGVHEKFVVEEIHHAKSSVSWWGEKERFVAMFIFRSHCKRELFSDVQMPFLSQKSFWKDLAAGFKPNSKMESEIVKFRQKGNALQTSCFLIIPERLYPDDDTNLIRNLLLRTQRLIKLADELWPVVNDKKSTSDQKFDIIKEKILAVKNLGDTWVKMLMVVIDIAKPQLKLLQDRCEVGIGASDPMRKILEDEGLISPKVKKEMGPRGDVKPKDAYLVFPSLKAGIIAVKKNNVQLIQVTKGMAGTLDKANQVALKLAELANKGLTDQEKLKVKRQAMFDDAKFKVPKLGLDAQAAELIKRAEENGPSKSNPDEPTPTEALMQLRERINSSNLPSAAAFWKLLDQVEAHGRRYFSKLPLMVAQMKTQKGKISAATLQVQLCEVRQFDNFTSRVAGVKRGASEVSGESAA